MRARNKVSQLMAVSLGSLVIAAVSATASSAAATPVTLGAASNFGVIAGGGLINAGQSTLMGDLGVAPVISYVDSGLLTVKGGYHFGDQAVIAGQTAAAAAYTSAATQSPAVQVASELSGQTLLPGVYANATGLSINGTVNLDAQNNPNSIFILQTPLTLTAGAASHINLLNGAQACNVIWQVGTTSSLGAGADFKGNLLGKGNFTSAAGSTVQGRILIAQGSVSLNNTQITVPPCKDVKPQALTIPGNGDGAYTSQYGNANFSFRVTGTDPGTGIYTNVNGRVTWNVDRNWKFVGSPTAYTYAAGSGTITGTGTLDYFAAVNKGHDGRWLPVSTSPVNFTIKFTRATNANGTIGRVNTFAIGFTGTATAGTPQLPALGSLVQVKGIGDGFRN